MNNLDLYRTEMTAYDGTPVRFIYDQDADILEVFFGENEAATGVELTDQIVMRLNKQTRRAVSLLLLHFSILTERTEYGPRSYPLNKLNEVSEDLRELIIRLMTSVPVNQFLKLSYLQASPSKQLPFTFVESQPIMVVA